VLFRSDPGPWQWDVDLAAGVQLMFNSRRGADTYIVQISTSPTFSTPEYTSPIIEFSPLWDDMAIFFNTGNLRSQFGSAWAGGQLWWRVGVRNSQDNPGPVPSMGLYNMNYLFSEPSTFNVAETPPSPDGPYLTARAGFSPDIDAPEGGIRIGWTEPFWPAYGHTVLEYHIWRDIEATPVGAVEAASVFVDDVGSEARKFIYTVVDPATHTKTTSGVGVNRPATGIPHQYYVSALYQIEQPAGSGIFKYFETDKLAAGLATITRRTLTDDLLEPTPGQTDVDLVSGINFQFNSREGADTYIIQVSASPTFSSPEYTSPIIQFSRYSDSVPISFHSDNVSGLFNGVTGNTPMWWRVGARNSLDNPGPVANMGLPNMNYLFSEPSTFYAAETPPVPGVGSIVGRVIDGDTSLPISGATITCSGIATASGADGRFTIPNVPSGIRSVTAAKGSSSTTVQVLVQADLTTNTGDMQLSESGPPPPPPPP
jgi:hypothetical protein